MKRCDPDGECLLCRGTGLHSPIVTGHADPVEAKKFLLSLPDQVECFCTFDWFS